MKKERKELKRTLGQGAVWAVALGAIIGSGCFTQGANWTKKAGGTLPLLLGFMIGALLMIVIGYSYSYMIAKFPVAGGEFAYAYRAFGRTASYICGWILSFGYLSVAAFNATMFPVIMNYLIPGIVNRGYLYTIAGYEVYLGEILISVFLIILFGIMNYKGIKMVGKIQFAMTILMCTAVAITVIGSVLTEKFSYQNFYPLYGEGNISVSAGFLSILAITPFLYVGFDCIPQTAEEYNFPPKRSKRIIGLAIIAGACIYIGITVVTDGVIPWNQLFLLKGKDGTSVKWITGTVLEMTMGKWGVGFVTLAVSMAILAGINGFFLSATRLMFSMSRSFMLPQSFSKLHKKYKTPSNSVIFATLICCIFPFFGREVINWLIDMCSVGTAVGYFFTCACALYLLKRTDVTNDNNKINPVTALTGCVISITILLLLIIPGSPAYIAIQSRLALIIWIGIGFLFYLKTRKALKHKSKQELDYMILGTQTDISFKA